MYKKIPVLNSFILNILPCSVLFATTLKFKHVIKWSVAIPHCDRILNAVQEEGGSGAFGQLFVSQSVGTKV